MLKIPRPAALILTGVLLAAGIAGLASKAMASTVSSTDGLSSASTPGAVFKELWSLVGEQFFDPAFNGVDWAAQKQHYGPLVAAASTPGTRARLINEMLATLETSHTRYLTPADPAYYQLLGIFLPRNQALAQELEEKRPGTSPRYVGIGIFTERDETGRLFVRDVIHGLPAAEAGLKLGDELLAVDGEPFHPIASFAGRAGEAVQIRIRRERGGAPMVLAVTPRELDGATLFLTALEASMQVVERDGRRIAYARPWSYAGQQYQTALEQAMIWGALREAETLVLDLRGGWGGASPSYLNIFTDRSIQFESIARDGTRAAYPSAWTRPVVLLVDGRTRSGKELLAQGFRKFRLGPIIGERTAGAVVPGRPFILRDGSVLYLAVADARVDGTRLEGLGVAPDVTVPFDYRFAAGEDPQLEAALSSAVALVAGAGS